MSTLEKFGILVILILVVIIGVVAVWGVNGEEGMNPFDPAEGGDIAAVPPVEPGPTTELPPWPSNPGPAVAELPPAPVEPPAIDAPVSDPRGARSVVPTVDPVPAAGRTYVVKKGDTLTGIARSTLGDGTKWRRIVAANPGLDPRRMQIDQVIVIPSDAAPARTPVAEAPPTVRPRVNSFAVNPEDGPSSLPADTSVREVEVRSGDSWYSLAVKHFGDGTQWKKLMRANPGIGERDLRPGMRVKLPAAQ